MNDAVFSVSDFVAVFNQTLEYAYPSVTIVGELANMRIAKNRWVYFDLRDEYSSVKFFGTVQQLPGPLEDGMLLQVRGAPRLHNAFGFSVNVQFMTPVGEGSIKKAASLLEKQLQAEGLFDASRKRPVPLLPQKIGLITSSESAAYADFTKIINARWGGVEVVLANVQVQGEPAVGQIVRALEYFNSHEEVDVLVMVRGGGSADDLSVFSTEQVTRAVASSRTPTIVAIGHEVDVCLAELAADLRASTPSNAAELLVPDRQQTQSTLENLKRSIKYDMQNQIASAYQKLNLLSQGLNQSLHITLQHAKQAHLRALALVEAYNPQAILGRGFAIVRIENKVVSSVRQLHPNKQIHVQLADGKFLGNITTVEDM